VPPNNSKELSREERAIQALHMVYHERDFRVRVNDPTINFVRRQLTELMKDIPSTDMHSCPACNAGYNFLDLQPGEEDRR
jgi:hypothetical protein